MAIHFELIVVSDKFHYAPESIREIANQVVRKTVFDIERDAKKKAPEDTGFLKSSIQGQMVSEREGLVSVGAEYGIYPEFGTRFQRAQPYLGPAVNENKSNFENAMVEVLNPDNWGL